MEVFVFRRVVRKHESESSGLVQLSNFFRYMEECECAFFRSLGLSFFKTGSDVVFPRVEVSLENIHPVQCGDSLLVHTCVERLGSSSLSFGFSFFRETPDASESLVAKGGFSIVACRHDAGKGGLVSVPVGDDIRKGVRPYLKVNKFSEANA